MLTPELIEELRLILEDVYGVAISSEEAREIGARLVDYFCFLQKHSPKNKNENGRAQHREGHPAN